jgi:hypothetical protein
VLVFGQRTNGGRESRSLVLIVRSVPWSWRTASGAVLTAALDVAASGGLGLRRG